MSALLVRMVREYAPEGVVHIDVGEDGEITVRGDKQTVPQRIALEILGTRDYFRARTGSQLDTIRHLSNMGWNVTAPTLWQEVKS